MDWKNEEPQLLTDQSVNGNRTKSGMEQQCSSTCNSCREPKLLFYFSLWQARSGKKIPISQWFCCSLLEPRATPLYSTTAVFVLYLWNWSAFRLAKPPLVLSTEPQNILSRKGPTRTIPVQLLALLWTNPRTPPCAWDCPKALWTLVFQFSNMLWVKNLFLMSNLNLPDTASCCFGACRLPTENNKLSEAHS